MGLLDKIKEIEFEMSRTQKNKATEFHFAIMKSRLAKLRSQLLEPPKKTGPSEGFDVIKHGDARVSLIGFPSVGKSTRRLTIAKSSKNLKQENIKNYLLFTKAIPYKYITLNGFK